VECPPCAYPVTRECPGKHEKREQPCSQPLFSCGHTCGRRLSCGRHDCDKGCHDTEKRGCPPCDKPCSQRRECPHPCDKGCHRDPCPPCTVPETRTCHCGKTVVQLLCPAMRQAEESCDAPPGRQAADVLACGDKCEKQLDGCSHLCPVLCHPGPCPAWNQCKKRVTVRCKCKTRREERPCAEVQAYKRRGEPLQLECNQDCLAKQGSPRDEAASSPVEEVSEAAPTSPDSQSNARMRRRERRAQAAEAADEAATQRAKQRRQEQQVLAVKVLVVVVCCIVLGLYARDLVGRRR